jgi:hypothetical protein
MTTLLTTLLKITLVALVMWWLLHNAPIIIAPVFGAVALVLGFIGASLVALTLGATVGLVVVIVLAAVGVSIAAALAPVWLPLLAIVGLVALCRPNKPRAA